MSLECGILPQYSIFMSGSILYYFILVYLFLLYLFNDLFVLEDGECNPFEKDN